MLTWLKKLVSGTRSRPAGRRILRGRYDAASMSPEAQRNFAAADALEANSAASPEIRAILRNRGRSELINNPYMDGQVQTLSGDTIGRGPRLRMRTPVRGINTFIEREFAKWCKAVRIGSKLRLAAETVVSQGEVFEVMFNNPRLSTAVTLDLKAFEADQVATPDMWIPNREELVDGIEFDRWGNPRYYHFLKRHPGDNRWLPISSLDYDKIRADDVIHMFRARRPGQRRGIPRITSSLSLYPQRRDYRQSTLTAARIAAQWAILLEAQMDANTGDDSIDIQGGTTLPIEHGEMTALPTGYKANQMKAEHPSTNYGTLDDKLIAEGARPLNMPSNIAKCDSSNYNYASGRLDHQTYDRSITIDQEDIELDVLDRLLVRWMDEALRIPGYLPYRTQFLIREEIPHVWLWRRRPHVDPGKEAVAQKTRLESGTTTIGREIADLGEDFEDFADELIKEIEWFRSKGLVHPSERASQKSAPSVSGTTTENDIDPDDPDEVDDDEVDDDAKDEGASTTGALIHGASRNGHSRNGKHRNRLTGIVS